MAQDNWRVPQINLPRQPYLRKPPKDSKLKQLAFALEQIKHGHREYEDCACCYHEAKLLLPHIKQIFNTQI